MRNKPLDIIFLQETHSVSDVFEKSWSSEWGYKTFFNHFYSYGAGVSVLFKATFHFEILSTWWDPRGCILSLNIQVDGDNVSLVNVYAPNNNNPGFISELAHVIDLCAEGNIVLGGDFNIIQDFNKDKLGGRHHTNFLAKKELMALLNNFDLVDIWRKQNPAVKCYTWTWNHEPLLCVD